MEIELWAIIDKSIKTEPRFCYAHKNKSKGAMALYDRKPIIEKEWQKIKEVVKVKVEVIRY